ncbi:MAG TPA: TIGR02611 family protein [Microbacterium sp.]|uniref:TIGR02611 family protein n=1 Tax=Microbacterium sp. TaxID=51671 RepID=UPI002B52FD9B|nr:TIGR02611 family protein [Microbacterium sp.]HWI32449.1 TIGR02611 family protein [Microbacterium sp.]
MTTRDASAGTSTEPATSGLEWTIRGEIAAAERPDRPIRRVLRRARAWMSRHPALEKAYRVGVGVLGGTLTAIGLLLVPLPGPGWLVVFLGLAVLGTEFHWARRVAAWLKRTLDRFWAWYRARRARRQAEAAWERAAQAHARAAGSQS